MYFQNGPSLSVDEQLYWRRQYEAFYLVFGVYVDMFCIFANAAGVQLLLLFFGSVHLFARLVAASALHDGSGYWNFSLHIFHAHECRLWRHDGHWHH